MESSSSQAVDDHHNRGEAVEAEYLNFSNMATKADEQPVLLHLGVQCDCCGGEVRGHHFKCLVCDGFDMCQRCERRGVHPHHPVQRLASPGTRKLEKEEGQFTWRLAATQLTLVAEPELKQWLSAEGKLQNVSVIRCEPTKLVSGSGWKIQAGRLRASRVGFHAPSSLRDFHLNHIYCESLRADKPFPITRLQQQQQLVDKRLLLYFEVLIMEFEKSTNSTFAIGLSVADAPLSSHVFLFRGSFAIYDDGDLKAHDLGIPWHFGYGEGGFARDDIVGCGLLLVPAEGKRLFFTKNGQIWGKPIVLECDEANEDLYPTVCSRKPDTEVVVNFGGKPFLYNLDHLEMIDDV